MGDPLHEMMERLSSPNPQTTITPDEFWDEVRDALQEYGCFDVAARPLGSDVAMGAAPELRSNFLSSIFVHQGYVHHVTKRDMDFLNPSFYSHSCINGRAANPWYELNLPPRYASSF